MEIGQKKLIAAAVVVVVSVGIIGLVANQNNKSQLGESSPNNSAEEADANPSKNSLNGSSENTIYYTDSGFEPADITIEKGDTVTWVKQTDSSMWIGSNIHPTHGEYDGSSTSDHCEYPRDSSRQERIGDPFDSCADVETFSFTFEKEGEFGYHNHEPYSQGGVVTVE